MKRVSTNTIEAANRAEVTALLIRAGYRVYRSEADIDGEDLVLRTPAGDLLAVQLKGRPLVDWRRYGDRSLSMLFPSSKYQPGYFRDWYLVSHDELYSWVKKRHGRAPGWNGHWSYASISQSLRDFLDPWKIS